MKLISCHVENFGKLSDLNMNFSEGINIINQPNGWGKSTLAAFFRVMLYGFDNKKEPGALDKERRIYRPWQGGVYGGELDIEINGKKYRISRTFGNTEKTDEFHLYDLATNLECDDYSENIGEELFGLDRGSFKRSIYIAQNDCYFETSDSINAKLGNLVENTNDINNYESAQKLIKDMINRISPDRITGSIKKRKNTITALKQELKGYEAAEESAASLNLKLEEKKNQQQELLSIRQEYARALQIASKDSTRRELKSTYEALLDDEKEKKHSFEEYKEIFPNILPSEEDLNENIEKARKIESLSTMITNLEFTDEEDELFENYGEKFQKGQPSDEIFSNILQKSENINRVKEQYGQLSMKLTQMESLAGISDTESPANEEIKKSKKISFGVMFLVIGIIIGAVSVFLNFYYNDASLNNVVYAGCGGGIVLLILGISLIVLGNKKNKQLELAKIRQIAEYEQDMKEKEEPILELREELEQIQDGVDMLTKEVSEFFKKYSVESDVSEFQRNLFELQNSSTEYTRLLDKKKQYMELKEQCDKLKEELSDYGRKVGITFEDDIVSQLNFLKTKASEYKITKRTFETAFEKRKQFEDSHDMEDVLSEDECPYSLDELNGLIKEVDGRVEDVRTSIQQYTRQLEIIQEQLDLKDEKEQELVDCSLLQEKEMKKYDILKQTQEFLTNAKESFTSNYMAPISRGFSKYYGILTNDMTTDWQVDANISVKIKEQGELRDIKWLSAGYQDLVGVCMRLALVDAMYPEEKPFLILDDPFVNLDDEKMQHGKDLLINLERDYQAIYFTCHESREYK